MHLADLVLLVALLASSVVVVRVAWYSVRGPRNLARRIARDWAIGVVCYAIVLLAVSLVQPGRSIPLGEDECFDDWCIAVVQMEPSDSVDGIHRPIVVTVRISNRGRGRAQAEPDAYVYLRDESGRELPAAVTRGKAAIGDVVPAGQSRDARVEFDVPRDMVGPVLVKARGARFPANIIIGDPASYLHRPTVHLLTRHS